VGPKDNGSVSLELGEGWFPTSHLLGKTWGKTGGHSDKGMLSRLTDGQHLSSQNFSSTLEGSLGRNHLPL
jgi:hypothetical protein